MPPDVLPGSLPWPIAGRTDLRDRLVSVYSTGRDYHDLRHLAEVLERLGELGQDDNAELVLAAWFHDAVYETTADGAGSGDNEEQSARLAEACLDGVSVHGRPVDAGEVGRLVRLTRHHDADPGDRNAQALCDADLAILAAAPERYCEYVAGVRREYADYSDADFRAGRLAVLEDLASREALFRTAYAREHWEPRARENLDREIAELRAAG